MARSKTVLCYLAIGFLIMGLVMNDVEGRRFILPGRIVLNRSYYRPSILAPWAKVLLFGVGMLAAGGVLYFGLKKCLIDSLETPEGSTYHAAVSDEV